MSNDCSIYLYVDIVSYYHKVENKYQVNEKAYYSSLINYNNKKILLDCGSGISRLLKFPDTLEDLNVIITHYHRDHFGDIGSICYASYVYHNLGLLNNKINIFLPKNDYDFNK